jgi:sensor histidine kinase YesM
VLYGDDFRLEIESHEGQGTIIRIDVPELVPVIPEVSLI